MFQCEIDLDIVAHSFVLNADKVLPLFHIPCKLWYDQCIADVGSILVEQPLSLSSHEANAMSKEQLRDAFWTATTMGSLEPLKTS